MQKSILVPIILCLMMIIPAFGMPVNVDYNQTPVESFSTSITTHEPMQEHVQEFTNTGNVTAGDAPVKV